jgi:tetratricopeptide (TPR) repeat protein
MADNQIENPSEMVSPERLLEMAKSGEIPVEYTDQFPTTFTQENMVRFGKGEITWGELQGISLQEAYSIADIGYTLFQQGRLNEAQVLYEALVMANPADAYFHGMLGAIYAKKNLKDQALEEYNVAISQDPKAVSALVNRAELLLEKGNVEQALADLKSAIELDPKSENPSTTRARAIAALTAAIVEQKLNPKK